MKRLFHIIRVIVTPAVLGASLLLGSASAARAQQGLSEKANGRDRPTLEAALRTGDVTIDGKLRENAWTAAEPGDGFVQAEPSEGAPAVMPTEIRVLYDDQALYVGARMFDVGPLAVADHLVRRDRDGQYDYIEVALDPNLDRRSGYLFRVGASGVELDAALSDGSIVERTDVSWDAVWESAVRVDSAGWSAELRIPFSQLRYERGDARQTWGVNFIRRRLASNSVSHFSLESRTVDGRMNQWGVLDDLRPPAADRRIEVRPYVVSEVSARPAADDDPLTDSEELTVRAGLDLSYGVGSAFTLDATANPDFGQVEVDPAVVNLSAFETFFPEKRPFFVDDADLFHFQLTTGSGRLFFSRRIGRPPRGGPPAGTAFFDAPDRTTILGAGKFTGTTSDGLSLGVLAAVTDEETGRGAATGSGEITEVVVEPSTEYAVGRVRQDLREGATRIGALVAGVNRHLPATGRLDHLASRAYSAGVDFDHQWGGPDGRRYSFNGFFAGTHVRGSPEAVLRLQTNPQHYFQRPDATGLGVDSTASSMTGRSWRLDFGRQSAENWTWAFSLYEISPGFAPNDIGFNSANEEVTVSARTAYQDITPDDLFRSWRVSAFLSGGWRHALFDDLLSGDRWDRAFKSGLLFVNGGFQFRNNWRLDLNLMLKPEVLTDTETRGGPLMVGPSQRGVSISLRSDARRKLSLGPALTLSRRGRNAGDQVRIGLDVAWRPAPGWELRVTPRMAWITDAAQYVATAPDASYTPTFGARYLFSDLERTQVSMETRVDVAFTPDLSLQLFAQPLLSAGDFVSIKQLVRSEGFEFQSFDEGTALRTEGGIECRDGGLCSADGLRHLDFDGDGGADFAFPEPDFNLRSMRANAVLRWEFRPGSTLFFVWQNDLRNRAHFGDFDFHRDLEALLEGPAENTFIVKASYYLDP